jgi:enterobactin synthetase component F
MIGSRSPQPRAAGSRSSTSSPDDNLVRLVEAQALATPESTAIATGPGSVTYHELMTRVGDFCQYLMQRGITAEQPVGILMRRSPDLVAGLLAILKVGGAYVPLDPDDPAERNRRILESSGCQIVLGDQVSITEVRGLLVSEATDRPRIEFIPLDQLQSPSRVRPHLPTAPGGGRLAYILYTSGSTGAPKGVEVEHRSVVNLLRSVRDLLGFTARDRTLATATVGFDLSIAELFLPLICGGSLLLRDRSLWQKPRQLADDIRRYRVTVLQTSPSAWSAALAHPATFPRIRVAITTAEAVSARLAARLAAIADRAWNLYGPTEATVWTTAHPLAADAPAANAPVPIGRAIAGTRLVIVDASLRPVAEGMPGELCLGGPALARGYRHDPALTRERFIAWGPGGERFYRTGDIVTRQPGGELHFVGRNDDQLKLQGVRIEPREIEAALLAHRDIVQAAVTWFAPAGGANALVAAVVTRHGQPLPVADLRTWLARHLPLPMLPAHFLFRAALPLAPSGKVDRHALRADAAAAVLEDPLAPRARPLSPTEATLAEIWRRILKVESVGPADHFFRLGGDSLAAAHMVTEAEATFRITLPVSVVFSAPTLARFARRIERNQERSRSGPEAHFLFPLVETGTGAPLFFSNVDLKLAARDVWQLPCPLYSVSHWAQGSGFLQAASITDLARTHLAALRAIQPAGPYRLAGYSFGALVALEMDRQLRAAGQQVEFLFLLDPLQPYRTERAPHGYPRQGITKPLDESWLGWAGRHVSNLARRPAGAAAYILERLRWHLRKSPLKQWLMYQLVHLHGRRPNPVSYRFLPRSRWPAFWYGARRLARDYIVHPHRGRVLAVFPHQAERYRVWRELLGPDAEIHVTEANPDALFDPPALEFWMRVARDHLAATPARSRPPY